MSDFVRMLNGTPAQFPAPPCTRPSQFETAAGLPSLRLISLAAVTIFFILSTFASTAFAETRTLRMYYTHTKESITVTFKKDGKYVKSGLKKLNRFLRDFRRNEPTRMDPKLFDLVWEVYQQSGCKKPIQVISGYRSPRTNAMLRRRGRKVARSSQHTRGKALDFFLPGVSVTKLRALGLKAHRGGVGYYRGSFVHLDTGRVRHWPRMSRRQLSKVFPRGRTIHVPSDGRPLKGYKVAAANLKRGLNYDGSRRKFKGSSSSPSLLARILTPSEKDGGTVATAKKKPAPVKRAVAKKPATPKAKKQRGADPFAVEVAANSTKPERKPEVVEEEPVEETVTPVLPQTVAIPRRRPVPPSAVPQTQLALADPLEPVSQADLALATPTRAPNVLRPRVDIPQDGNSQGNQSIVREAVAATEAETEELKARIRQALTRQRQLATARSQATLPAPRPAALQPKSVLQASLTPSAANPAPSARAKVTQPTLRQGQPALETSAPKSTQLASSPTAASGSMTGELKLGNLDGADVRAWAVAHSTRVGPIAALRAPVYDQGTLRLAPSLVYSAGFANNRPPLRADRFTGRALTRVAFADLRYTN